MTFIKFMLERCCGYVTVVRLNTGTHVKIAAKYIKPSRNKRANVGESTRERQYPMVLYRVKKKVTVSKNRGTAWDSQTWGM